ncbi:MFS transporter, partial [Chloroflexota bacterium]
AKYLSSVYFAGLWSSPLGGYLSDRIGRLPIIIITSLIGGILLYLLTLAPYGLGISALLLALGITIFVRMPVAEAYLMDQTTARNRSTIFGVYYFANMEAGAVFAPVVGYLFDHVGFHSTFTIASVAVIAVTVICAAFLWSGRD